MIEKVDLSASNAHELTQLLQAWSSGDQDALPRLIEASYGELQKIANGCLRGERADQSMQANSLVHDAYLRLVDIKRLNWQDRVHFFAMARELCAASWWIMRDRGLVFRMAAISRRSIWMMP